MSNLVKETFGVHSTRPELACPSSSVLQQLEDREWKVSLKKNLEIASRAVYLEGKCSESLAAADFTSPETPFLFQLEKTMLDLSSPSLTDGEFYCSFFKLDDVYYCRFFESGVLQGYFLSEGMSQLKNYFEEHRLDMTTLVWLQVSTQDDIKQYHRRYTLKLERKRSHHSLSKFTILKYTLNKDNCIGHNSMFSLKIDKLHRWYQTMEKDET